MTTRRERQREQIKIRRGTEILQRADNLRSLGMHVEAAALEAEHGLQTPKPRVDPIVAETVELLKAGQVDAVYDRIIETDEDGQPTMTVTRMMAFWQEVDKLGPSLRPTVQELMERTDIIPFGEFR